ncbi:penicillin-binding transpeptidase domain-containing protein [Streptomyces sp. NPDC058612]|uniref:penicillin-binding transpeptidase domain-containing protein n=1 Tax=Streptomyces sp. NPDC058612 TaxID=3346555 RepID=UPI00364BDD97
MPKGRRKSPRRPLSVPILITSIAVSGAAIGGAYAMGWGPFAREPAAISPEALTEARGFLADWAAGDLEKAAARTDAPEAARKTLVNFTTGLDITGTSLEEGDAKIGEDGAVEVGFDAKLKVKDLGAWDYGSTVPLKKTESGGWVVAWRKSLVHPALSDTEKLRLQREAGARPEILDRAGGKLTVSGSPLLAPSLAELASLAGAARGRIERVDRGSGEVKGTEATFGPHADAAPVGPVRTTIDAEWQSAAEKALSSGAKGRNAALVTLRIDNGEVLAVANTPAKGFNRAFSGTYAPASTWKIVTSAALLLNGAVASPDSVVDCPERVTVGKEFTNVGGGALPGATFLKDFTMSCNTAFVGLHRKLGDAELGTVASRHFGIGQTWAVGVPSYDGSVPVPASEGEKAAAIIGQGRVLANPLTMASVVATAASGTFHQPTIVHGSKASSTKTEPLPESVVTALRRMMRATVTDGTASVLASLPGQVGAKTGTAEVGNNTVNNGWLVAYRGNVALACLVEQGETGSGSAGPVIKDILKAVPIDPK